MDTNKRHSRARTCASLAPSLPAPPAAAAAAAAGPRDGVDDDNDSRPPPPPGGFCATTRVTRPDTAAWPTRAADTTPPPSLSPPPSPPAPFGTFCPRARPAPAAAAPALRTSLSCTVSNPPCGRATANCRTTTPDLSAVAAAAVGEVVDAEAAALAAAAAAAAAACLGSGKSSTAGRPRADSPVEHVAWTASLPLTVPLLLFSRMGGVGFGLGWYRRLRAAGDEGFVQDQSKTAMTTAKYGVYVPGGKNRKNAGPG